MKILAKKKKILLALIFILLTSHFPNFIFFIWLNDSTAGFILKHVLNYLFFPVIVYFIVNDLSVEDYKDIWLPPKWFTTTGLFLVAIVMIIVFIFHTAFDIDIADCYKTNNGKIENHLNCLDEVKKNRINPF